MKCFLISAIFCFVFGIIGISAPIYGIIVGKDIWAIAISGIFGIIPWVIGFGMLMAYREG